MKQTGAAASFRDASDNSFRFREWHTTKLDLASSALMTCVAAAYDAQQRSERQDREGHFKTGCGTANARDEVLVFVAVMLEQPQNEPGSVGIWLPPDTQIGDVVKWAWTCEPAKRFLRKQYVRAALGSTGVETLVSGNDRT